MKWSPIWFIPEVYDKIQFDVDIPRDRDSSFEPQVVKKQQTCLTAMDDKIHCLYAKGMTTREIAATFKEMYDADVSPTLISKVIFSLTRRIRTGRLPNPMPIPRVARPASVSPSGWGSSKMIPMPH